MRNPIAAVIGTITVGTIMLGAAASSRLELSTIPKTVQPRSKTTLRARVSRSPAPAGQSHIIVVSRSFDWFRDLHPNAGGEGWLETEVEFPKRGHYLVYALLPPGKDVTVGKTLLKVGRSIPLSRRRIDTTAGSMTAGSYDVILDRGRPFAADKPSRVTFLVLRDGEPATEIRSPETSGHLVAISADSESLIVADAHQRDGSTELIGPEMSFQVTFPTSGIYKLWLEFEVERKLHVVEFGVKVD